MLKSMLFGGPSGSGSWVSVLGGTGTDEGASVAVSADGSIYVCGTTSSVGSGGKDIFLAKFDSSGTIQWQRAIGGTGTDEGASVAVSADGSIYVCGSTNSEGAEGYRDIFFTKFDSSGNIQWQKAIGGTGSDEGASVAVSADGSIYVCGNTNAKLFLSRHNSYGDPIFRKTTEGKSYTYGYSIATYGNYVYTCGTTNNPGVTGYDILIVAYNSSGDFQWQRILGGSTNESDQAKSIAVSADGSIYVCGHTSSTGSGDDDIFLAKFDNSGRNNRWQRAIGGTGSDKGASVAVSADGSIYVCGTTSSVGSGGKDIFLAKYNSSGTIQWQRAIGGTGSDEGASVAVSADGSIYVCGTTSSTGSGGNDCVVIRITEDLIKKK